MENRSIVVDWRKSMPEVTNQRMGELIGGALSALKEQSADMTWRDLVHRLEQLVPATSFEDGSRPGPVPLRRYGMIARFCCDRAAKAGWISRQRDIWTATDSGRPHAEAPRCVPQHNKVDN